MSSKNNFGKKSIIAIILVLMTLVAQFSIAISATQAAPSSIEARTIAYPRYGDPEFGNASAYGSYETKMNYFTRINSGEKVNWRQRPIDNGRFPIVSDSLPAGSKGHKNLYCLQPSVRLEDGAILSGTKYTFTQFLSNYDNGVLNSNQLIELINKVLTVGYDSGLTEAVGANSLTGDIAYERATQLVLWEVIVGERGPSFNKIAPKSGCQPVLAMVKKDSQSHYNAVMKYYNQVVNDVISLDVIPSFMTKNAGDSDVIELEYSGGAYIAELVDTNGVLGKYNFSTSDSKISVTKSGNKLILSASKAPEDEVLITANKTISGKHAVLWANQRMDEVNDANTQSTVSTTPGNLSIRAYLKAYVEPFPQQPILTAAKRSNPVHGTLITEDDVITYYIDI